MPMIRCLGICQEHSLPQEIPNGAPPPQVQGIREAAEEPAPLPRIPGLVIGRRLCPQQPEQLFDLPKTDVVQSQSAAVG